MILKLPDYEKSIILFLLCILAYSADSYGIAEEKRDTTELKEVVVESATVTYFSSYFDNARFTDTRLHSGDVLAKTTRFWNNTDLYVTFLPNSKLSVRMNVGLQATKERAGSNSVSYVRPKAGVAFSYRASNNLWARLNYWLYPAMPSLGMTEDYGYQPYRRSCQGSLANGQLPQLTQCHISFHFIGVRHQARRKN